MIESVTIRDKYNKILIKVYRADKYLYEAYISKDLMKFYQRLNIEIRDENNKRIKFYEQT